MWLMLQTTARVHIQITHRTTDSKWNKKLSFNKREKAY